MVASKESKRRVNSRIFFDGSLLSDSNFNFN